MIQTDLNKKGKSFRWVSEWKEGEHYFNTEFVQDFCRIESAVVVCKASHFSTQANKPRIIFDEQGREIGIEKSAYWEIVILPNTDFIISGDNIPDGIITTNKLADGAVTTPKIAEAAVTTEKINDYAVIGKKISSGAITNDKIRAGAVSADKLADSAVTTPKLTNNSVITEKITDASITTEKLKDSSVTNDKIADSAISQNKLRDYSVTFPKIAANAVTSEKIAVGAVNADKIADGAVIGAKLASGAVKNDKIRAGAVSTDKIANQSITYEKLVDGAVIENKLGEELQVKVNNNVKVVEQSLTDAEIKIAAKNLKFRDKNNNFFADKASYDAIAKLSEKPSYCVFGNGCYNNTFGYSCNYSTFGNSCHDNIFGNDHYFNTFGNFCHDNIFGSRIKWSKIDSGVEYIKLISNAVDGNYLENIHILSGVKGASQQNPLVINIPDEYLNSSRELIITTKVTNGGPSTPQDLVMYYADEVATQKNLDDLKTEVTQYLTEDEVANLWDTTI